MRKAVVAAAVAMAAPGDIIMHSDADEISRPYVVHALRACQGYPAGKLGLSMRFTYYAYSVLSQTHGGIWKAAIALTYDNSSNYDLNIRDPNAFTESGVVLDAGWHCSSCFRTYHQYVSKIRGFSHVEYGANATMYSRDHVVSRVRRSEDLFDRPDELYSFKDVEASEAPLHVLANKRFFAYLLDRRGPTALIEDVDER